MVPRDEALAGLGRDAESVLERLTEARLVSVIKLHRGEAPRVELTHGSLIHTWHTLASLVERGEDEHRLVEEANQAADLWAKRGRRREELWRGQALRDAERHLSGAELPGAVMEFLRASDQEEQQNTARRRFVRIGSMLALGLVTAVALVASVVIIEQRAGEEAAKQRALARAVAAERLASTRALAAARAALNRRDPSAARHHLLQALISYDHPGAPLLWHEISHMALRAHDTDVAATPPSPRARVRKLSAAGMELFVDDEGVVLLTSGSSKPERVLPAPPATIHALAMATDRVAVLVDGALLAGSTERLHSFDIPHPAESIAFDDGGLLVVEGGGERTWWDVTRAPLVRAGHPGAVHAIASMGDGVTVTIDGRGTWRRFDDTGLSRAHPWGLARPDLVALSPDGRDVAAVTRGALVIWSPPGAPRVIGDQADATALALSNDGLLAVAGRERVALWDTERGRVVRTVTTGTAVAAVAVDDDRLVVADREGGIRVFDGVEPGEALPSSARATALSIGGTTLAIARSEHVEVVSLSSDARRTLPFPGVVALSVDADGTIVVGTGRGTLDRLDASDGRPVSGGIVLMPDGELLTTRGRRTAGERIVDRPAADRARWMKAARKEGRLARQLEDGAPLCMLTVNGELAIWSTGADRLMGEHPVAGVVDVVGLPSACAARSDSGVVLSSGGEPHALDVGAPSAIGWAEQRLLVATNDAVITFSESGDPLERHHLPRADVSAVTQRGSTIVVGHRDGQLTWLETVDGTAVVRTAAAPRAVTALSAGPAHSIVAGHADGTLAIHGDDGSVVWRAQLDGAVDHLRYRAGDLVAASRRGDLRRWSFEGIDVGRCALLATLLQEAGAPGGQRPLTPSLPDGHPCRDEARSR